MDKKELIHLLEGDLTTGIRLMIWLWSVEDSIEKKIMDQLKMDEYEVHATLVEAALAYNFEDVDLSKGVEAFVDMLIEDAKEE